MNCIKSVSEERAFFVFAAGAMNVVREKYAELRKGRDVFLGGEWFGSKRLSILAYSFLLIKPALSSI